MRPIAVFVLSILALTYGRAALGQPSQCRVCRTAYPYGHCPESSISNPPEHGVAFAGTVVAAKPITCGVQITVDVTRSSSPSLPATIVIDVESCSFWTGAIADAITAVVFDAPKQSGAYDAHIHCARLR